MSRTRAEIWSSVEEYDRESPVPDQKARASSVDIGYSTHDGPFLSVRGDLDTVRFFGKSRVPIGDRCLSITLDRVFKYRRTGTLAYGSV